MFQPPARIPSLTRACCIAVMLGTSMAAQTTLFTLTGANNSDALGTSAAFVGDVNSDGFRDWVVGVPGGTSVTGHAVVVSGFDGSTLQTLTTTFPNGAAFGQQVAGLGDVNGDSVPDIAVGAPNAATPHVIVFSGATGLPLFTVTGTPFDGLGSSIAGIGDWNGDTVPDVAIGGFSSFRIVSGINGATLFTMAEPFTLNGVRVAGLGDLNQDGYADIAVAVDTDSPTPSQFDAGVVRVLLGPNATVLRTAFGATFDFFGHGLAAVNDVDADGVIDYAVGASQALSSGVGYVRVYSGATGNLLFTIPGVGPNIPFGQNIALAGDVNADGRFDIIIGVPNAGPSGSFAGAAFVYSGLNGSLLGSFAGQPGVQLGAAVAGYVDPNADAHDDVILCEPGFSTSTTVSGGRARVVSLLTLPIAGALPVGTGCVTSGPPPVLALLAPPILGQATTFALTNGDPNSGGYLVASPGPAAPFVVAPGCTVYVDLFNVGAWIQIPLATTASGSWSWTTPIVNLPVLAGVQFTTQVALLSPASPIGVSLSNGVLISLGY